MSNGNRLKVSGEAVPCVEPAPKIGIVVRFGGCQAPAILTVGEPQTLHFGTFRVEVEVVDVIRQKIRPAKKPPYNWIVRTTCGYEVPIRAMNEDNALRLFRRQEGDEWQIEEIRPEIS